MALVSTAAMSAATRAPVAFLPPADGCRRSFASSSAYARWTAACATTTSNDLLDDRGMDNDEDNPSVAVIGSGAVGGYYGARLWESGRYNVHFHMRGEHLDQSKQTGLMVTSIDGDVFVPPDRLSTFTDPREAGTTMDWVIVALKSSSLEAIPELIYPLLEPGKTRVLCIMNGLIEDDLIALLKEHAEEAESLPSGKGGASEIIHCCGAVYGGMALICSNRLGPGRIDHSYAGRLSAGVAASNPSFSDDDNQRAFEELFRPTLVRTAYETSLLAGRWRKCVWNLPFNGISVSMGGLTVDKIVTDPGLRRLAYDLMDETIRAANTDLQSHGLEDEFFLDDAEKEQMMDLSDTMGPYRTSTMIDFVEGRRMEVKYLFRKPMERAQHLGVQVPKLETIVAQIEALEKFRQTKLESGVTRKVKDTTEATTL